MCDVKWGPTWGTHPGAILAELIREQKLSQRAVARMTGMSAKHVNMVIQGKSGIGVGMALGLERAFDSSAELWMRAQMLWDLAEARGSVGQPARYLSVHLDGESTEQ